MRDDERAVMEEIQRKQLRVGRQKQKKQKKVFDGWKQRLAGSIGPKRIKYRPQGRECIGSSGWPLKSSNSERWYWQSMVRSRIDGRRIMKLARECNIDVKTR
jgi:hypothetical protein